MKTMTETEIHGTPTHACEVHAETGWCAHRPPLTIGELEVATRYAIEEVLDQLVDMSQQIGQAFRVRDGEIGRAFQERDRHFARLVKAWNKR